MAAYLERRGDLVRVFTGRLRSASRAEDLVQAMFEKIATVPASEEVAHPVAFIYRLGANLLLDEVRQRGRQAARESAWSALQGVAIGAARATDAPGPEQAIDARARLSRLLEAVDRLPPQTRRAFTLHKLQGMSHAQTAAALGVSRSAVEKHISLALKLLVERVA